MNNNSNTKDVHSSKKNIWSWIFVYILLLACGFLTYLYIDLQSDLDYSTGQYDRSLLEIESLMKDKKSLLTEIEDLYNERGQRVKFINSFCKDVYVFIDGRLVASADKYDESFFYIPPGTYDIRYCHNGNHSDCGGQFTKTIDAEFEKLGTNKCKIDE